MRPFLQNSIFHALLCLLLVQTTYAQTLNRPEPAPNPNFGHNMAWTAACASANFNEYFVNFTWSPPVVNSDNEFILELSDHEGSFDNPVELDRTGDHNDKFDFDFSFSIPQDTQGENYRFRVRSTSPEKTSAQSDAFPMYYAGYNSPILISENGNGNIPPGGEILLCAGATLTLAPHNVPNAENYSYSWTRSGTLLQEKGHSITIDQPGIYMVEIDYGPSCSGSANTLSNPIDVLPGNEQGIAIENPSNTALCPGETVTLTANITGQAYQYTWYKDGNIVAGPTIDGDSFLVDANNSGFEGDYQVEISGTGICIERSDAVSMTNPDDYTATRGNAETMVILPTQSTTLTATTNANNPQFQWFKDNAPLANETSSSLTVSSVGQYYARITQTGGNCSSSSRNTEATQVITPTDFVITIEYTGQYSSCESSEATLSIAQIFAVDDQGNQTDVTEDMADIFLYHWLRGSTPLNNENAASIIITDSDNNGEYSLNATIDAFSIRSNTLDVQLGSNEAITISADNQVLCQGAQTAQFNANIDLNGITPKWLKDGREVSTSPNFSTTEAGTYQLEVTLNNCTQLSNELIITNFDERLLVLDQEGEIVISEGSSVRVTASGASSYQWFDENSNPIGTAESQTFTEAGSYTLLATIGNCQVLRELTVVYKDSFVVPNVITANGDGINDLWVLPNTFSKDESIRVIIFNEQGEEVLNQANYQNNWPQSSVAFSQKTQIFYYKIRNNSETLKQGTITVLR